MNEKLAEAAAARKAINEAKRAKKGTRKPTKKVEQAVQDNPELTTVFVEEALKATEEINDGETTPYVSPSESIVDVLEEKATEVSTEGENVTTASVDSLELIPNDVGLEKVLVEGVDYEQSGLDGAEVKYVGHKVVIKTAEGEIKEFSEPDRSFPSTVGLEEVKQMVTALETPTITGENLDILAKLKAADTTIDFTNGRSKPAVYVQIGGSYTQEGTYFDKMMREIVYILTLGGKFDRQTAPRFSQRPYIVKMKVPLDKYNDYINRVGYPDYETDGEYYRTSMSAPDFRVLLNFLEQRVSAGWEIDTKQPCMNNSRYVIPFRTRFPVENTAGLHTRVREPIKYTVEELRSFEWDNVKRIAALHGITDTNHNSVISQLKDLFEEVV